jgi:hypothetical protein
MKTSPRRCMECGSDPVERCSADLVGCFCVRTLLALVEPADLADH